MDVILSSLTQFYNMFVMLMSVLAVEGGVVGGGLWVVVGCCGGGWMVWCDVVWLGHGVRGVCVLRCVCA